MERNIRCNRKRKLPLFIKQSYLDWLPCTLVETILKEMSYEEIEKASKISPLFGAVGRQLVNQGPSTISKRASKQDGQAGQACIAALKVFSACTPICSPIGKVLDACNKIINGTPNYHLTMELVMSIISLFGINNYRIQINQLSPTFHQFHHIFTIMRILQSFKDQTTTIFQQVNPTTIEYNFTLPNCWLGLIWRGRRNNMLCYEDDYEELQDCLLRLSLASNTDHTFRMFKRWNEGDRTCVLGYDTKTRRNNLHVSVRISSLSSSVIEKLLQKLEEPDVTVYYTVEDECIMMFINFDCRAAISWGCDRKFYYYVGWDEIDE